MWVVKEEECKRIVESTWGSSASTNSFTKVQAKTFECSQWLSSLKRLKFDNFRRKLWEAKDVLKLIKDVDPRCTNVAKYREA